MKKLQSLSLTRLNNLEFEQHVKSIYTGIIEENESESEIKDASLIQYLNEMNLKSLAYDKSMLQIVKSDETAKIFRADETRDKALTCIQRHLSVFEFSPHTNQLLAFVSLNTLFSKYKGIQNWNYEKQTSGIDNLIADLQSEKYSDSAETIRMTEFAERLQTTNNDFKLLFNGRTHEQATKEVFDVKELRGALKISYENLINYVLAMAKAVNTDEFNQSLKIINAVRKYYSDMIAKRISEKKTTAKTNSPTMN